MNRRTDRNGAGPAGDASAVERERVAVGRAERADAAVCVELDNRSPPRGAVAQCTIFEIGSSMMPLAPCAFNAGIKMLISDFATTVSTA